MKRLLFLLVGSAVIVAFGGAPAFADNGPHVQHVWTAGSTYTVDNTAGTDRCAGCHRAHTAQGQYLLKQEQPGLCFTCHGSGATGASTDVVDGAGYTSDGQTPDATRASGGTVGALRGGGFQFALLNSASPQKDVYLTTSGSLRSKNQHIYPLTTGAATTSAHTVNGSDVTAWGNGAVSGTAAYGSAVQLECTSCHDPHGNGNFRILKGVPDQSGATTAVNIPDANAKVYVTNDYWETGDPNTPATTVGTTTVDSFTANITAWCTTCHTRYLAGSGSYKTNSGDAVYTYKHRSDAVKALSYTDGTGGPVVYPDLAGGKVEGGGGANCITCHVAHGSNATMGDVSKTVTNPDGSAAYVNTDQGNTLDGTGAPALGDSRLLRVDNRGMCLMCHSV
jgi:predicted CXXCH cytochrome family protein